MSEAEISILLGKIEMLESDLQRDKSSYAVCETEITNLQTQQNIVLESREYYRKAIDLIYERSIEELKITLNTAISFIFPDKVLEIDILLNDKRGKSLSLVIKNNGRVVSLKDGMGMGVNCVISAILHIYYLHCKGSRILMLDESYHNISADYIARFFEFIEKLCRSLDFKLVLITHDERVMPYASKVYKICDGEVSSNGQINSNHNGIKDEFSSLL